MWLELDGSGALHQQLYRGLRQAILEGVLSPGSKLPATRSLASEIAVSRNTVLRSYEQLLDEGYVIARTGAGTYIASVLPEDRVFTTADASITHSRDARPSAEIPLSRTGVRMLDQAPAGGLRWDIRRRNLRFDFRYGEPAYADLPHESWCRLVGRHARRASARRLAYGDSQGSPELRRALGAYLRKARGVVCGPEQIVISLGSEQAIDLVARLLVDPGDRVAIEEPHYTGISYAFGAYGAELVSIPVDESGLPVDELPSHAPLRGVCITPSNQFPSGGVMPLARRFALLAWAQRERAFVLEDDYDGEYRYEGKPIPSLQSLDRSGSVLYVGTASKMLFPSLRIGWLVLPESLVEVFRAAKAYSDSGSASLEQHVLADFIEGGHLERHVRRSRVRNAARRAALSAAVVRHLGGVAELVGMPAGLHGLLWVRHLEHAREAELRRRCEALDVGIYPVHPCFTHAPERAGYLLGYAALDEKSIEEGVRRIGQAIAES